MALDPSKVQATVPPDLTGQEVKDLSHWPLQRGTAGCTGITMG